MAVALYNTLTRRVEPFVAAPPARVTLYTCGPTVWNYAHIGNFRTLLFEDLLRRYLAYSGYDVFHIMNLTDVDDRTIKAAAAAGKRLEAHTAPFVQAFFEDRDYLRITPAHVYPRATQSVPAMVRLVERLLDRGVAYRGDDGSIYFAIAKFPSYGRLSRLDTRELKVGARVASDEYAKDDPRDFALWKKAEPVDEQVGAAWDAPFGRGRPGWHLECSHVARGDREVLRHRNARRPRRRRRFDLSASRRRDRAVRSGDRQAVRALLGARRVPQRAWHEDVEAVREFSHGARSARSGRGRRGGAAPLLADALSQGAGFHRRRARGRGCGREAAGGVLRARERGNGKP